MLTHRYYLRRYQRRKDIEESQYEPIFYLTEAEGNQGKDLNYLQVIYKVDRINADRRRAKLDYERHMGDYQRPAFDGSKEKEYVISLSELAEEGLQLLTKKQSRLEKEAKEAEEYKAKLKRIYKFRKFKDDTKFDKLLGHVQIDLKELEQYEKCIPTKNKKTKYKKIKLRIEAQPEELEKSFNDEDDSQRSNESLRDAGEVEVEDTDMRKYTFGIHELIQESGISDLVAQAIAKQNFSEIISGKNKKNSKLGPKVLNSLGKLAEGAVYMIINIGRR